MQITVNVEQVDLSSVVGTHHVPIGDGEYEEQPQTLADVIAEQATRDLRKDDQYRTLKRRVLELRDEEIRTQVTPIVADALRQPIQKTNSYGHPIGEPTTLTELIVAEAQAVIKKPIDRSGYGSQTLLQKLIADEVQRAMKAELTAAITDERNKVIAAVRGQAAEILAQALKQGLAAR